MAVGLVWLERRARTRAGSPADTARTGGGRTGLAVVAAVLSVLVAVANLVQVYRVGDSGAQAVWQRTPAASTSGGER